MGSSTQKGRIGASALQIRTAAGDTIDIVENTGDVVFREPGQTHK